jgi:hypothetical protein
MSRIDDELETRVIRLGPLRPKMVETNLDGLPVEEFCLALQALEKADEVHEKRIMFCRVCNSGDAILVETGQQHGGCNGGGLWVLLVKDQGNWRVDGVRGWRS